MLFRYLIPVTLFYFLHAQLIGWCFTQYSIGIHESRHYFAKPFFLVVLFSAGLCIIFPFTFRPKAESIEMKRRRDSIDDEDYMAKEDTDTLIDISIVAKFRITQLFVLFVMMMISLLIELSHIYSILMFKTVMGELVCVWTDFFAFALSGIPV